MSELSTNYKAVLSDLNIHWHKNCRCGGHFTEVYKHNVLPIEVRIRTRTERKTVIIKEYGRVIHTSSLYQMQDVHDQISMAIQNHQE